MNDAQKGHQRDEPECSGLFHEANAGMCGEAFSAESALHLGPKKGGQLNFLNVLWDLKKDMS